MDMKLSYSVYFNDSFFGCYRFFCHFNLNFEC